jgi:WD40 repeat protein
MSSTLMTSCRIGGVMTGQNGSHGPVAALTGHGGAVNALSFSSNGQLLATGSSDKTVILWDLSDPTRPAPAGTLIGDGREVYAVAFGPDGRLLVTGSGTRHSVSLGVGHVSYSDGAVALWNLADRSHPDRVDAFTVARSANDGKVHAAAFSPDGRLIATTGDPGTAVLWDVSDASRLTRAATLGIAKWYESIVYALAFAPGGRLLATGRNDKTVVLWEISDPWHPTRIAAFRASDPTLQRRLLARVQPGRSAAGHRWQR